MGHGIDVLDDRASAAYWKDAAWHRLGAVVEEQLTATGSLEVANLADLDYHLEPLYVVGPDGSPQRTDKWTTVGLHPLTRERRHIGGYLAENFALETPEMLADFADQLVEGGAHMNAIGLVDEGRRMFISLHITDLVFGGIDRTSQNLLVTTGFDGSLISTVKVVNFRVECANMLNMALGRRAEHQVTARHTGAGLAFKVDEFRRVLDLAWKSTEALEKEVERLLDVEVTKAKFQEIVHDFVPMPDEASPRQENRVENQRGLIYGNYFTGNAMLINDTAWGAYNALSEFVDHQSGAKVKDEALRSVESFMSDRLESERARAMRSVVKVLDLDPRVLQSV